jgi:hypothetical protein
MIACFGSQDVALALGDLLDEMPPLARHLHGSIDGLSTTCQAYESVVTEHLARVRGGKLISRQD